MAAQRGKVSKALVLVIGAVILLIVILVIPNLLKQFQGPIESPNSAPTLQVAKPLPIERSHLVGWHMFF